MDGPSGAVGDMAHSTGAGPSGNWGGVSYVMPVVSVPYVNSMGQVNVHCPPSQDAYGKDLPLSADVNTLRYFFNLGVEYFGISAHIQQKQQQHQQQQQQHQQQQQQQQQHPQYCYPTPQPQLTYPFPDGGLESAMDSASSHDKGLSTLQGSALAANDSRALHVPRGERSPSVHSPRQRQGLSSSSSQKDVTDFVSDVSDSGFTSSGEGEGEQGREEDDLDASVQQESGSGMSTERDPTYVAHHDGSDGMKAVKEKGKRKYYVWGSHKLIKPIKDIPPRFMQLLTYMKTAKERCLGQPIYMAEPLEHEFLDHESGPGGLNVEAQCFYPRRQYSTGLYINSSEVSSIPPPPMVPPPPGFMNVGGQLPTPFASPANNSVFSSQNGSVPSCMASHLPLPHPPAPHVYVGGPGALDGNTPFSVSLVKTSPSAEAHNKRPAPCDLSCKAESTAGASSLPGTSQGSPFALPAAVPNVPPPLPAHAFCPPVCSSSSNAAAESSRLSYSVYQSQSSFSASGLQVVSHATSMAPGQMAYIVTPLSAGQPPSCPTFPPPVVGLHGPSASVPCPPLAVQ